MNENHDELIKRIDAYIDCDDVRERESETQLLEDCRAALSRKYVPMTDDELHSIWLSPDAWTATKTMRMVEAEVIRRAGLEVEE